MELSQITRLPAVSARRRTRQAVSNFFWYLLLLAIAAGMVLPFLWIIFTSLKGTEDAIFSVPPQLIPQHPTLNNFKTVLNQLPIGTFFLNSILVGVLTTVFNVIVTASGGLPAGQDEIQGT